MLWKKLMIHLQIDKNKPKGWLAGPWNSNLEVSIGYANEGINEPHYHTKMREVYLIAKGESVVKVNNQEIKLVAGDLLVVEPNETHTFINNSDNYMHFVIHTPFVKGDKTLVN